jgi:hypothetical protein
VEEHVLHQAAQQRRIDLEVPSRLCASRQDRVRDKGERIDGSLSSFTPLD